MKAVVWTDALQFIVYSGGIIAILGIVSSQSQVQGYLIYYLCPLIGYYVIQMIKMDL